MRTVPIFVRENFKEATALLKAGVVQEPLFSRGTYQVEIQEKGKKKFFPFLQMNDDGELTDSFCSCEKEGGCQHLAAAYLRIFNGFDEPLHIRFKKSFWNRLFQMAAKRHGYETSSLKKKEEGVYFCESKTKRQLFSIKGKSPATKKRLEAIVSERPVETEETSLKFSNWSAEEIGKLREGKGGHSLRYELSFWSDLAKWLMAFQDENKPYTVDFEGLELPQEVTLTFPDLRIWFYISEVSWPWLIPSLATIESPLKVFELKESGIETIKYDPKSCSLFIHHSKIFKQEPHAGISIGDWLFVKGQGFYRRLNASLFQNEIIPPEKMADTLTESYRELQSFLPIDPELKKLRYHLHIDKEGVFHIEPYLFELGDLKRKNSSRFLPWVYLDGKGFFQVEEWLFEDVEKLIPKEKVADFINRHRLWLHQFPGFQTHLGSLESHLIYHLSSLGELSFEAKLNFPEGYEEAHHFDEWVYVPGFGFYMLKESSGRLPLHPGLKIQKEEISSFISAHKEELEQVQGFFSSESFIRKTGLNIGVREDGLIFVEPKREFSSEINPENIHLFGDFVYVEGKGFSEIPPISRLPDRFQEFTVISSSQEPTFLAYELEPLKPYILWIDSRLQKPQELRLKIRRIVRDKKKRTEWLVALSYDSEIGVLDPFLIWDAFQEKKRHLFSSAGLIFLKDPRFNWIRQLSARRLDRKRGLIRLNTLEWLRLMGVEEIKPPLGSDPEAIETRKLLEELDRLETHRLLDISQLKATLRPYQEQGLHWLWFLYCHGLSGLLCDDMGLGKTHQAMALLAAVDNEDVKKENKYLVVCPTSVIYHWQELLKRFLPNLKVCVYYGLERSLEDFEERYHILLTSYGILRMGREDLHRISFEVAIFDEVQIAKNHASQTNKALRMIRSKMRLGLSGTPIENRLRELKALFDVVLPTYLPIDTVFRDTFINPIEKFDDEFAKKLLSRLVKPFILRRKKRDVLTDLPEKIEEIAYCDLSDEQKELYRATTLQMRDTVYQDLKDAAKPIPYIHVFSALTTLKRICDHPALATDAKRYQEHSSGKWDLFVELLNEARGSGQKVVVFSQYLEMLAIIEAYLKKKGIGFASIKGSTRDRNEQLRKFREDPQCEIFVASLLAAGVGLDLTVASIVIHYDRWWNPAKENQATDRVHRIGQSRGVQVFKLVTKNTIEEHIHELIEKKKGLLENIIGTEDQITYLTREELIQVFEKMNI